jgi:hypothetical protein
MACTTAKKPQNSAAVVLLQEFLARGTAAGRGADGLLHGLVAAKRPR